MHSKKQKIIISIFILVCCICILFIVRNKDNKSKSDIQEFSKHFSGVSVSNNKILSLSEISIDGNIDFNFKYPDSNKIDKLTGTITIDGDSYRLDGVSIIKNNKKYIGATAYEKDDSKFTIFLLDDYDSIAIFDLIEDNNLAINYFAPAKSIEDTQKIISMMP